MKRGYRTLVEEAMAEVKTYSIQEARAKFGSPTVQFVDVRDIRELKREGGIPGAFHAPRGMLEFWVDPDSPYHADIFSSGKEFIFFCSKGWRSALATKTVQDMGLPNVAHIGGGFTAWRDAGGPIAADPKTEVRRGERVPVQGHVEMTGACPRR